MKGIELINNNLPKTESTRLRCSEFYYIFKADIIPILYNLFQTIYAERILSNSFYEANIALIPNPDKNYYKKAKLQSNISNEHQMRKSST